MLSFSGSTSKPHFIACNVYSCPLKIEQFLDILSFIFFKFVYISVAFPSKNLPIAPENKVSPVNAH
jgi:hypothetical protein